MADWEKELEITFPVPQGTDYIYVHVCVYVCFVCLFVISSVCGCLTESSEELSAPKVALSVQLQ